jgi:two-component system sensor histidine kinase YesM
MRFAEKIVKAFHSYPFKLSLIFSIIVLLMTAFISLYLTQTFSDILMKKEYNFESQIARRVMDYTDDTIDASREIVKSIYLTDNDTKISVFNILGGVNDVTSFDYLRERNKFDILFSSPLIKDNNILDVILYKSSDGEIIYYSKNLRRVDARFDFSQYAWFKEVLGNDQLLRIIPSYRQTYMKDGNRMVYTVVSSIFNGLRRTTGLIMINLDTAQLEKAYAQYSSEIKGTILVMNSRGEVLYDSSNTWYGQTYPYFSQLGGNGGDVMLDKPSIVSLAYSRNNDLLVADIVPKSEVDKYVHMMLRTIYAVLVISLGVALLLVYFASELMTKRIKKVTNTMMQVEKGDLSARMPVDRSRDEIHQISLSFNRMCGELGSYIDKVYVAGIRTKDAELKSLQMQINPHFLNNTLEAIRMKAVMNRDGEVGDMIYLLADLFKSSMRTRDMMTRVRDEINYCRSYLEIHRIRYRERLAMSFNIDEAILEYKIPKLVLQPLVENCVMYGGLDKNAGALVVSISGRLDEAGNIELKVEDNGAGMSQETLAQVREGIGAGGSGSIGLANIDERIRLIFGEEYGLEITSETGRGTSIRLLLPAMREEDGKNGQDTVR